MARRRTFCYNKSFVFNVNMKRVNILFTKDVLHFYQTCFSEFTIGM